MLNAANYRVEEEEEVQEEVVTHQSEHDYGSAGSGRDDYRSDRDDDE